MTAGSAPPSATKPGCETAVAVVTAPSRQYRNAALEHYRRLINGYQANVCSVCGFGIPEILEVAHLDQQRSNNHLDNLAVLCPNCHKMHDLGLIPTEVVRTMRSHKAEANWALRMKDAATKAGATRRENSRKKRRSEAGRKAAETRARQARLNVDPSTTS